MREKYFIFSVLIIVVLFFSKTSSAQTYFDKEFGNDSSLTTLGASILAFSDTSSFLVIGAYPYLNTWYLKVIRLDINGDTIWTKSLGTYEYIQEPSLGKCISIGDTNIVFVGNIASGTTDSSKVVLYKIDVNGNLLWEYYFGDSNKKNVGTDLQQTPDGGFIITGWTTGWGNTIYTSSFLLKVDASGNEQWHKIYGGGSGTNQRDAFSVDLTDDNGYIFSGSFYQGLATRQDINVIKTDSLGNVIWNKIYGTAEDDGYGYITKYGVTNDYILASVIDIAPGNVLTDGQAYITRLNGTDGSIVWADTFGIADNVTYDGFSSNVIVLANGDIVGIGLTQVSSGGIDTWLVKYDGNGNMLWKRTFNKNGGNNHHYFWDVQPTFDKGFIICGDLTNLSLSEKNLWVLKLDSMGCEIANCSVGVEESPQPPKGEFVVYPNPTNGIVTIQYDATTFTNSTFKLFDVMGKEILTKQIHSPYTKINVQHLAKGIYFYIVTNEKERYSGKLIKN